MAPLEIPMMYARNTLPCLIHMELLRFVTYCYTWGYKYDVTQRPGHLSHSSTWGGLKNTRMKRDQSV